MFGTYLCAHGPVPTLVTPGTLPSLPVPLPGDLTDLLPDTLRNGVDQFALGGGNRARAAVHRAGAARPAHRPDRQVPAAAKQRPRSR